MIGLLCNQTVSLKTDSKTLNGVQKLKYSPSILKHNKNVLTVAFSLACLEIRSRNKEVINSTTNTIYSLKVFYFLLYRSPYFLFVSELIQYACQRRPEIPLRYQAIRVYEYTKIQGPRFQIFITENKLHAHHKDPFAYSQKVYNNQTSEFC